MDQVNQTDENELQKAINNITNTSESGVAGVEAALAGNTGEPIVDGATTEVAPNFEMTPELIQTEEAPVAETVEPVAEPATENTDTAAFESAAVEAPEIAGVGSLAGVKASALSDLRPILDRVELPVEHKFKIYKEIITATNDSEAIEPAYNAAKGFADDKERAEALLFVIESIDRLSAV